MTDETNRLIIAQVAVKAAVQLESTESEPDVDRVLFNAKVLEEWILEAPERGNVTTAVHAVQNTPAASQPISQSTDTPKCPKCNGDVWDNRPKKASGEYKQNSPDFKCRNKACGGVIWPAA